MKKSFIFFLVVVFILSACSKEPETGIRKEILNEGVNYVKLMQESVLDDYDNSVRREINALAVKYTNLATDKYDYNEFTKDEKVFTDDLGNLRIAFDDAVYNRNPKYNSNQKLAEDSMKKFDELILKFENKYKVSVH
jgi:Prokaryotic membrane lipoprotein lipid attachment site